MSKPKKPSKLDEALKKRGLLINTKSYGARIKNCPKSMALRIAVQVKTNEREDND